MLKITPNKEKKLKFALSPQGTFHGEIKSYFRIYFENFNIGFPADVSNFENVIFILPKITDYINFNLPGKAQGSLEIISDRDIFLAWQDEIEFKNIDIKAVLKNTDKKSSSKKKKKQKKENNENKIENILVDNFIRAKEIIKNKKIENNEQENKFTIDFIENLSKTQELINKEISTKKYELKNKTKENENNEKREKINSLLNSLIKAKEIISEEIKYEKNPLQIEEEEICLKEVNLCDVFKNTKKINVEIDNDFINEKNNNIKKYIFAEKIINALKTP